VSASFGARCFHSVEVWGGHAGGGAPAVLIRGLCLARCQAIGLTACTFGGVLLVCWVGFWVGAAATAGAFSPGRLGAEVRNSPGRGPSRGRCV